MLKTLLMLGIICLLALIIELDFFIALSKFGAKHFGAPDDIKEMMDKVPDKPKAVVVTGFIILSLCFIGIIAVFIYAFTDTYKNYGGFMNTFLRFLIILEGYKLFDIVVFDYLLLTKIRLPEKLCPETKGAKGYDSFGFNAKSQIIKIVVFALASLFIAFIYYLIMK